MTLGFSYIGLIFLFLLFIPNLFWTRYKPKDYDKYVVNENKILLIFERVGQVLVTCMVLIFSDLNINTISLNSIWLLSALCLMILYEINWVRYFRSIRTMKDFYESYN